MKSYQSSENVLTKNITQTETPLDPNPVQKSTDTAWNSASNQNKYKQNL